MNTSFQIKFKDYDEFAAYVSDSLFDLGEKITDEFNSFTGLSLPIGANVYQLADLPNTGKNYAQFGTVKAWLYDLYEIHKDNNRNNSKL
ncbi:hypothetical protein CMV03_07105 [Elizabethkingia anophelis]|nr:hypothetical protein [Elizabethkingia anophelis]